MYTVHRKHIAVMLKGSCYTVLCSSLANLHFFLWTTYCSRFFPWMSHSCKSSAELIGNTHFISLLTATILAAGTAADSGRSGFVKGLNWTMIVWFSLEITEESHSPSHWTRLCTVPLLLLLHLYLLLIIHSCLHVYSSSTVQLPYTQYMQNCLKCFPICEIHENLTQRKLCAIYTFSNFSYWMCIYST